MGDMLVRHVSRCTVLVTLVWTSTWLGEHVGRHTQHSTQTSVDGLTPSTLIAKHVAHILTNIVGDMYPSVDCNVSGVFV